MRPPYNREFRAASAAVVGQAQGRRPVSGPTHCPKLTGESRIVSARGILYSLAMDEKVSERGRRIKLSSRTVDRRGTCFPGGILLFLAAMGASIATSEQTSTMMTPPQQPASSQPRPSVVQAMKLMQTGDYQAAAALMEQVV